MYTNGFFQVPNYVLEINLTTIQKLVFICLFRTGNQGAAIYPSYETIARRCSISDRTAKKVMKQLEIMGVVHIKRRKIGKRNNTNLYTINLKELERMYGEQTGNASNVNILKSAAPSEYASPGGESPSLPLVNVLYPINNPNSKEPDIKNHKVWHEDKNPESITISFEDYKAEHNSRHCTQNILATSYFIKTYSRVLGKEHKRMRPEVWKRAIEQILDGYDMTQGEAEYSYEYDSEEIRTIIDCYFMKTGKFE